MKRLLLIGVLALAFVLPAVGGAFLEFFNANSSEDNIILTWKTRAESNLDGFEVQRKTGNRGDFMYLATITPKGSNSSYTYTDRSAFKSSSTTYVYRIKILDGSGQPGYSQEVEINHSVSSVKRTWGYIKAMFR